MTAAPPAAVSISRSSPCALNRPFCSPYSRNAAGTPAVSAILMTGGLPLSGAALDDESPLDAPQAASNRSSVDDAARRNERCIDSPRKKLSSVTVTSVFRIEEQTRQRFRWSEQF